MFGKSKSSTNLESDKEFIHIPPTHVFAPILSGEHRASEMIERLTTHLRTDVKCMEYKAHIETGNKTVEVIVSVKSREEDTQGERP